MANTLLTTTKILNKALEELHNSTPFIKSIDTQYSADYKAHPGVGKGGASIQVRVPVKYAVSESETLNVQDTVETTETITVNKRAVIGMNFYDSELALSIDEFNKRYIKPAMSALGAKMESTAMEITYQSIAQSVGTPGTDPATTTPWLDASTKLDNMLCPRDGQRYAIMNPAANGAMVGGLQALFNNTKKISDQYDDGVLADALGLKFKMGSLVRTFTTGTRTNTTPLIDDVGLTNMTAGTTTMHMDGFASATATITKGDVFTIAGVYAVNPETFDTLTNLKQFVVTALATCASNEQDIVFSPPMYSSTSGVLQNVSAFPANDAAVTFYSATASTSYAQNLVFHKSSIAFVTIDEDLPKGMDMAARDVADGISMRMIRGYDIVNNKRPVRIEVVYGVKVLRPEWCVRVWGK